MRANRRRDTGPELTVRRMLHSRGLRYRVDYPIKLPGRRPIRPDVVFAGLLVCVRIQGCWWHGCAECSKERKPPPPGYWSAKIARNIERDGEQLAALRSAGWTVLTYWEHDDPAAVAADIEERVAEARQRTSRDRA
ncbi:very short patch repair endonuclease [Solirubrobacter soli]|uniref:very short patch repair endonuclease n=1 Tax=Solirubrobacter soli TaxID=363832 RepID=UPI000488F5C8